MNGKESDMSTVIRPELSKRNEFYISRHRYYELKHYCLQYKEWEKAVKALDDALGIKSNWLKDISSNGSSNNPIDKLTTNKNYYLTKMEEISKLADKTNSKIGYFILKGVTEGYTYEYLAAHGLLVSRSEYYESYRKFFWLLDKKRE